MARSRPITLPQWKPRARPLLVLADQGQPRPVPIELLAGARRDRNAGASPDGFLRVNRVQLDALAIAPLLEPNPEGVSLRLRPDGLVGAIPLLAPDSQRIAGGLVVRPRFGWDDIGVLLSAIGWSAAPQILAQPLVPGSAREVPPWVLAGPILQRIEALLQTLSRGFRLHEEVRQQPRGQILWGRYVAEQMARGQFHQLPCRYPELGPDLLLRAYLRWGLEQVHGSLAPWSVRDRIARLLIDHAERLLEDLRDIRPKVPDRRSLDQLARGLSMPSQVLRAGLEALGWVVDERGLAGQADLDGLAWRLTMHALFERWVEHLARRWAHDFGARVDTAEERTARYPLRWQRPGHGSLSELAPDIVVHAGDTVYVIDAKYKGHFEELDDHRWRELQSELQAEHRHDLHQVLAYAALFDAPRIVSVLVYPLYARTWATLSEQGGALIRAEAAGGGRTVEVALAGVPLQLPPGCTSNEITQGWQVLRRALAG